MKGSRKRILLRASALLPAVFLGVGLILFTQRQANESPPSKLETLVKSSAGHDPLAEPPGGFVPKEDSQHVIMITSKRIEMPVFHTKEEIEIDLSHYVKRSEEAEQEESFLSRLRRGFLKLPGSK